MTIELSHKGLVRLVMGGEPGYEKMDKYLHRGLASYTGGFLDKFGWDSRSLAELSDEELYQINLDTERNESKHHL